MCGITGIFDIFSKRKIEHELLVKMSDTIVHRGPDESGFWMNENVGFGFRRLSIVDLKHGHQPFFNHDKSIVSICNGEIFNFRQLREDLEKKDYSFKTECDVEVIIPLYMEYGHEFVKKLNGQFAIALYDINRKVLFLYRDHVGIAPLFFSCIDNTLIFGSEIKSILQHPLVNPEVDFKGLDQIISFPGMVSPTTMFKGISALKPGHYAVIDNKGIDVKEYWDLDYPYATTTTNREDYYIEKLDEALKESVRLRLMADVPIGFYLSGGLDSSLIGGIIHSLSPQQTRHSFSIGFTDHEHDERSYQTMLSKHVNSKHHEVVFDWEQVSTKLRDAIYFAESPLKETYNTCSMALSHLAHSHGVKVILTGEGADELFAGYVGYRFDQFRKPSLDDSSYLSKANENKERNLLWGDKSFFYEKNYYELREIKESLYSERMWEQFNDFNAIRSDVLNKAKLSSRHPIHKRSYVDFKLRLSDHLLADHGDRVAYSNSIEARYPFLDVNLIEFTRTIPPELKLKGFIEKYIVKKVADKYIPQNISNREKFHFVAPGSPMLLKQNIEWVNDLLSNDAIQKAGYFNPATIERLKRLYTKENFKLNLPFDSDLMIIVLTFCIFTDLFDIPNLH
jgi:asparagine synthase (glutamine-hydrolysing)